VSSRKCLNEICLIWQGSDIHSGSFIAYFLWASNLELFNRLWILSAVANRIPASAKVPSRPGLMTYGTAVLPVAVTFVALEVSPWPLICNIKSDVICRQGELLFWGGKPLDRPATALGNTITNLCFASFMYVADIRCYIIQGRRLLPMNRPNVRNALRICYVSGLLCHWRNVAWSCCSGNAEIASDLAVVVPLQKCYVILPLFGHCGNSKWSCCCCAIAEMSRDLAAVRALRKWYVILLLYHCRNVMWSCCCSGTAEMVRDLAFVPLQKCHVILLLLKRCANDTRSCFSQALRETHDLVLFRHRRQGTWSCSCSGIAELTSDLALGVAEWTRDLAVV
jgi:hypothetical protein